MDSKYDRILSLLPNKAKNVDSHENNANQNQNGVLQTWIGRLDFPKFLGGEPTSWICKANCLFSIPNDIKGAEGTLGFLSSRIRASVMVPTSNGIRKHKISYHGHCSRRPFAHALAPPSMRISMKPFLGFDKRAWCRIIKPNFECLANQVEGWPEKALVCSFVGGLKVEIAAEINMFKPTNISLAIGFA